MLISFTISAFIYITLMLYLGLINIFNYKYAPHDSSYPFNDHLLYLYSGNRWGLFNPAEGLVNNTVNYLVHIPDIFFIKTFLNTLSYTNIQNLHTISIILIGYSLTYFSFNKILKNNLKVILLSYCYMFSSYLANFFSGGAIFTLSTIIGYSLIPLFIYKLCNLEKYKSYTDLIFIFLIITSSLLYFYPAVIFLLIILLFNRNKINIKYFKMQDLFISFIFIASIFYFFYLSISYQGGINQLNNAMYTAIRGGIFYPIMQISTWAAYTIWEPRTVVLYHEAYNASIYKLCTIFIFIYLSFYIIKNKFYSLSFILFASIFLAKGANPPLGFIFKIIIELPLGVMIRTPDTKFGAFIIASLLVATTLTKKRIIYFTWLVLLIFNILFIYKIAIDPYSTGKNVSFYVDENLIQNDINEIKKLKDDYKNFVLLTNSVDCAMKIYEDKLFSCRDLILNELNYNIIGTSKNNLKENLNIYSDFNIMVYINKKLYDDKTDYRFLDNINNVLNLYESSNIKVLFIKSNYEDCKNIYNFGCIFLENDMVKFAIPKEYLNFITENNYKNKIEETKNGIILNESDFYFRKETLIKIISYLNFLLYLYMIIYLLSHSLINKLYLSRSD